MTTGTLVEIFIWISNPTLNNYCICWLTITHNPKSQRKSLQLKCWMVQTSCWIKTFESLHWKENNRIQMNQKKQSQSYVQHVKERKCCRDRERVKPIFHRWNLLIYKKGKSHANQMEEIQIKLNHEWIWTNPPPVADRDLQQLVYWHNRVSSSV